MEGRAAAGPAAPGGAAAAGVAATDAPAPDAAATGDPAEDAGVIAAPWQALRRFTAARIALGRAGVAVPTTAELEFRLAHARARDAVHLPFDAEAVAAALRADGHETLTLKSAAADRHVYLQRPDLGRRLDEASRDRLSAWRRQRGAAPDFDLALVVADGLSALAVHRHATPLVAALRPHLSGWTLAPVVLVHQGRVAIGDEIGAALGAACVVVLIGERPGLSSPDSLGLYISWAPRVGLTDAARNCISNVRPEGLAVEAAAAKLAWLLGEARRRCLTGVALKDEVDEARPRLGSDAHDNFLVDVPLGSAGVGALRAGGNGGDGNDGGDGEQGKDGGQGGGGGDGSHGPAVDPAVRSPSGQDGAITAGPESRTAVDGPKRRADAPLKAATEPATAAAAPDAGSDPGRVGDTSPPRPR